MAKPDPSLSGSYSISQEKDDEIVFHLKGKIDAETSSAILKEMHPLIKVKSPSTLIADLDGTTYFDDFGALLLIELRQTISDQKGNFRLINMKPEVEEILSQVGFDSSEWCVALPGKKSPDLFWRLGDATIGHITGIKQLISFIGSVAIAFFHVCLHPKSLRLGDTILHMEKTGTDAVPVVGLISFLLGLIMAFMSALQLRQFGANLYVASLVALAMVSELGPLMTAIIVAGRSGSAFAAEIGTMKISEEIDALFTMGFNPLLFLAIPRIIASIIVVPVLTLFSDVFAIAGGLVVGVFMLDLTPGSYINQTIKTLALFDLLWGILKSTVFAALIAGIGCFRGFQARGGAEAVGNAATSAVVSSIFLIILFDSIFAVIQSYWR